jgi:hypothetical protein
MSGPGKPTNDPLRVVAVDVGSVREDRPNFAWCAVDVEAGVNRRLRTDAGAGSNPAGAADAVTDAIRRGFRVGLGFESPLVLPVPDSWNLLGRGRTGEGGHAWSAGAGATVLGSGLVQLAWVLRQVVLSSPVPATTQPDRWSSECPLLLWEAFVTGPAKSRASDIGHDGDAVAAANAFVDSLDELHQLGAVNLGEHRAFNLAVAAALHAELTIDPGELHLPLRVVVAPAERTATAAGTS